MFSNRSGDLETVTSSPPEPAMITNSVAVDLPWHRQSEYNYPLNFSSNTTSWIELTPSVNAPQDCVNVTQTVVDPNQPSVLYRIVVDVYIAGLLCLTGFFGNALSIAVLYRDREKQNTTNWLLQTLAFIDTVYLAACVFIQPVKTIHDFTNWWPSLKRVFPYMEPHVWGVGSIAQTATVWVVLLVTADRYVAVCMPLRNHWRSLQRAKVAVAVLLVAACLYNVPRFLERKMRYGFSCEDGSAVVWTQKTELRNDRLYFLVYKTICYFIFRTIGPLATLVVLNARLVRALQIVRRRHKDLSRRTKHRENITAMLVVVVTVFIVCELPDLGIRIAFTISEFGWSGSSNVLALRYANSISNTLLAVNSSSNFLIYCLVGKKFRRILVQMASCGGGDGGRFGAGGRDTTETELISQTHGTGVTVGGNGVGGRTAGVVGASGPQTVFARVSAHSENC